MDTIDKARLLEEKLNKVLPYGDDGMFGTDGSHRSLMDAFERAWEETDTIAREAIKLLAGESLMIEEACRRCKSGHREIKRILHR